MASCNICPHVGNDGSPNPRKLNPASVVIAAGTDIATLANAYGSNCGKICFKIIFESFWPIIVAASTYPLVLICNDILLATFAIPTHPKIIKNPIITNMLLLMVTERIIRKGNAGNA